jgi:t-SNARE complex subunit (syntaxin)
MDKIDRFDDGIDNLEYDDQNKVVDDNINTTSAISSRYKYILYIVLFIIFVVLVVVVFRVLFTNEPPLLVLNEMLNNTLEIKAVSQ